jgi:hypothetical protein
MPFARARALRLCALLALPASAFAQSPKTPTIFSPTTQLGTVNLRAAVVLTDYTVKPLPLLRVVAMRSDRPDSVAGETDLDGRAVMSLRVGTYTLRAKTAQPVGGRSYSWAVRVVVRPQRTEQVQLTNSNASADESEATSTVVAAAPQPTAPPVQPQPQTQPQSAAPVTKSATAAQPSSTKQPEKVVAAAKPTPQPRPTQPVDNHNKVVPSAEPAAAQPVMQQPASQQPAPQQPAAKPVTQPAPSQPTSIAASQPSPLAAPPAQPKRVAQVERRRSNTSGLILGLSFDASSIRSDDLTRSTESGPGLAGQLGWGFTRHLALLLDASGARISSLNGDFNLAHADVSARWHFVNRSALVPFLQVGYGGRAATKPDAILSDGVGNTYTGDLSIIGSGISAGGGFEYFATSAFALGGSFTWTSGKFTRVQFDRVTVNGLDIDATSARFNMGFTWYPMGR